MINRQKNTGLLMLSALVLILTGCQKYVSGDMSSLYLNNADANGLMIEGYDPVALATDRELKLGSPGHRSEYHGGVYHFDSTSNQEQFKKYPKKYAPLFGGHCAMSASMDKVEPGDVRTFSYVGDELVLQRNAKAKMMWDKDPEGLLTKAKANWPDLVKKHNGK